MILDKTIDIELRGKICEDLNLEERENAFRISFDVKIETSKKMTIKGDQDLHAYFHLIKNDLNIKICQYS